MEKPDHIPVLLDEVIDILNPTSNFYKYNPMLHGPFLYHLLPWVYYLLGTAHEAIRVIPALVFSILPFAFSYALYGKLKYRAFFITALLLTSPSFSPLAIALVMTQSDRTALG